MVTLKFEDTHNMVAFLSKPTESDRFEQIVYFFECTPHKLHALVDGKKIIITESSVRKDLQLADEEGVDCLPNSTIFEQLTLMGDSLAYLKLSLGSSIYKVWKLVDTPYRAMWDTAYWGFLRVKDHHGTLYLLDGYGVIEASDYDNSGPIPQLQNVSPSADTTVPSQQELDLLFGPLYDEFFNAGTSSVNNSSSPTDHSKQLGTPPTTNNPSSIEPTTPKNVNAEENNDNQAEDTQFQQDEFINPFCKPVREIAESSSRNIDNSNMHTFYQPHDSEYQ
ncbi:hypothetical protein Tco_1310560 [Tanacetum coccineum]